MKGNLSIVRQNPAASSPRIEPPSSLSRDRLTYLSEANFEPTYGGDGTAGLLLGPLRAFFSHLGCHPPPHLHDRMEQRQRKNTVGRSECACVSVCIVVPAAHDGHTYNIQFRNTSTTTTRCVCLPYSRGPPRLAAVAIAPPTQGRFGGISF